MTKGILFNTEMVKAILEGKRPLQGELLNLQARMQTV